MSVGFQVVGSSGFIQVDENFHNLSFITKGTITTPAATGTPGVAQSVTLAITGDTPMLFLRPINSEATVGKCTVSGSTHTYVIYANKADTIEWFLFDKPPAAGASGFGIEVRNAVGQTMFNSAYPPMRVVAIGVIPTTPLGTGNFLSMTLPAGTYAACMGQGRTIRSDYSSFSGGALTENFKISATTCNTRYMWYQVGGPKGGAVTASGGGGQIMVIDVSNL